MFFDATAPDILARALILACLGLIWVVVVVRAVGLRAFSKMTAFDFVITVAIGSLLAGAAQASDWPAFFQATLAIAALLAVQYAIARLRLRVPFFRKMVENDPVVLMRDGTLDRAAMAATRVSAADITAKLREANVLHLDNVRAVVLEATGDISVLHGDALDEKLLEDVSTVTAN